MPANNRNTPATRPTTTPGSALCNVLFITSQNFTGAALPIAARTTFSLRARLESNSNSMMSHSCPTQRIGATEIGCSRISAVSRDPAEEAAPPERLDSLQARPCTQERHGPMQKVE